MKTAKKGSTTRTNGNRTSTNGTNGAAKETDTSRRYSKKELEAMTKEEITLLAYRMTYDRVHGKRRVRN